MTELELHALIEKLRAEPHETVWLEFKANRYEPQELGEYLSALANSACLHGKPKGYLCFGIENQSHAVVGTDFDPERTKAKGNQPLLIWLAVGLQPNVGFEHFAATFEGRRVVLFAVNPAFDHPVKFYGDQKRAKIRNLTFDLAHRGRLIQNTGSARGKGARWETRQPQTNGGSN